jgi:phosphoserine aminotransferase
VPLNLAPPGATVDHIVTGSWSKKAAEEAKKYCTSNVAAKGDNQSIPPRDGWQLTPGAAYVHYCDNETIQARRAAV